MLGSIKSAGSDELDLKSDQFMSMPFILNCVTIRSDQTDERAFRHQSVLPCPDRGEIGGKNRCLRLDLGTMAVGGPDRVSGLSRGQEGGHLSSSAELSRGVSPPATPHCDG